MKKYSKEEMKEICKENKEAIFTICGSVILFAGCTGLSVKLLKKTTKVVAETIACPGIDIHELPVGELLDEPWYDGNVTNMIVNGIKIEDMGKFGEGLKDTFKDLTDNNTISIIAGLDDMYEPK